MDNETVICQLLRANSVGAKTSFGVTLSLNRGRQ
jgi:hypothetical protein